MKIIADENIPFVKESFGHLGEITLLHGRNITNDKLKNADILLVRSITNVNEELLKNTSVKFVATATIGEDHIDKNYLLKNNIGFSSAPGSNADSVAEYVVSSLFVLSKKYSFNLKEKTIGIIGVGNVGGRVKNRCQILGLNVLLNDPPKKKETNDKVYIELDELLKKSDIVTVHVPLNKTGSDPTFKLINDDFLKLMKNDAVLFNTSRGKVMDEKAIIKNKSKLKSLVLDVWENEPEVNEETLKITDIATPHIAGYSYDGKVCGTKMIYQAACKHFGIKDNWNIDISDNSLIIDLKNSKDHLYDAILQAYTVLHDDSALRKITGFPKNEQSGYFDKLRKEYPVRREFKNWTIRESSGLSREISETLKNLGFILK